MRMVWGLVFCAVLVGFAVPMQAQEIADPPQTSHPILVVRGAVPDSTPVPVMPQRFEQALDSAYGAAMYSNDSALTPWGILGFRDGKLVAVDPGSGAASTLRDGVCGFEGTTDGIAVVDVICPYGADPERIHAFSLTGSGPDWSLDVPMIGDVLVVAGGIVVTEDDATALAGHDVRTGNVVWKTPPAIDGLQCSREAPPLAYSERLAEFQFDSGCRGSATISFTLLSLRDGRIVDENENVPSLTSFFGESDRLAMVDASGGRWAQYGPARIFLYDLGTMKKIAAFIAAPDPPHVADALLGSYHADAVALGGQAVYIAIGRSVYRYPNAVTPSPGRLDPAPGTWLGSVAGDRLYFGDDRTLWAVDVSDGGARASAVAGAQGPFSSMVVAGRLGFALTRDRRIVTIDLTKNAAVAATAAPSCYFLLHVYVAGDRTVASCSVGDPVHNVVLIGLQPAR